MATVPNPCSPKHTPASNVNRSQPPSVALTGQAAEHIHRIQIPPRTLQRLVDYWDLNVLAAPHLRPSQPEMAITINAIPPFTRSPCAPPLTRPATDVILLGHNEPLR